MTKFKIGERVFTLVGNRYGVIKGIRRHTDNSMETNTLYHVQLDRVTRMISERHLLKIPNEQRGMTMTKFKVGDEVYSPFDDETGIVLQVLWDTSENNSAFSAYQVLFNDGIMVVAELALQHPNEQLDLFKVMEE